MPNLLSASIDQYFAGEKAEMILILSVAVLFLVAAALLLRSGEPFARGLSFPMIATALLFSAVAVPLLIRDIPKRAELVLRAQTDAAAVRAEEDPRLDKVIAGYPVYRYVYLAALAAAFAMLILLKAPLWQGLAIGLLFFAAEGYVIDHYSEARARAYQAALRG